MTTPTTLARTFCRVMNEWLNPVQMDAVRERNRTTHADSTVCATHDFCDANMAMLQAWQECTGGDEIDTNDEAQAAVWNAAWTLAKAAEFDADRIVLPTTELYRLDENDPMSPFAFSHDEVCVTDPTVSLCARFPTLPSEYGFQPLQHDPQTWVREFVLADGRAAAMLVDTRTDRFVVRLRDGTARVGYRLDCSDDPFVMADVETNGVIDF